MPCPPLSHVSFWSFFADCLLLYFSHCSNGTFFPHPVLMINLIELDSHEAGDVEEHVPLFNKGVRVIIICYVLGLVGEAAEFRE